MEASSSGLRVHLHEDRAETAVATSYAHGFVSLSACDEYMIQQCDKAHTQADLKRKRWSWPCRPETNLNHGQRRVQRCTQPSEHLSSEGISSELEQFELAHIQSPIQHDHIQESSRVDEGRADGRKGPFHAEISRAGKVEPFLSASSARRPDASKDPRSLTLTPTPNPDQEPPSFVTPRTRSLRAVNGAAQSTIIRPPSSVCAHCPSRTGSGGELSSLALSAGGLSPLLLQTSTETPPGVANAFEIHEMRVRCLAPKRPLARSLVQGRQHGPGDAHQ